MHSVHAVKVPHCEQCSTTCDRYPRHVLFIETKRNMVGKLCTVDCDGVATNHSHTSDMTFVIAQF